MRLLLLLLLLPFLNQDKAYDLVWKPKAGSASNYAVKLDTKADDLAITFKAQMGVKVVKVEKSGDYTLETLFKNASITINGEEEKLGDEDVKPETDSYRANGEKIGAKDVDEEDGLSAVISRTIDFTPPIVSVKVGQGWIHNDKAEGKQPASRTDYELVSVDEKVAKISYTFKELTGEKPVTAKGTFLLSSDDFSLVRVETEVENVRLDEQTAPTTAKIVLEKL